MKKIPENIIHFLQAQGCVIVSTIDKKGFPHSACKGIVEITKEGRIYLLDLYRGRTYSNLKVNPALSITALDEHRFLGFCLKGKAKIVSLDSASPSLIKAWEDRITNRLTQRVLKNLHGDKGHARHPEILLPKPEYLIALEIKEIIDLTPYHIKQGGIKHG